MHFVHNIHQIRKKYKCSNARKEINNVISFRKFEFLDSPGDFEDPFPGKMDAGNANLPGFKVSFRTKNLKGSKMKSCNFFSYKKVRRQSRDIANLLEVVADKSEVISLFIVLIFVTN